MVEFTLQQYLPKLCRRYPSGKMLGDGNQDKTKFVYCDISTKRQ